MQNPFLFEAEDHGYESELEDSFELYENEYGDSEYEDEVRRGRGGRFSARPVKFSPRSLPSSKKVGRVSARPSKFTPRSFPSKRPLPSKRPRPLPSKRPRRRPLPYPAVPPSSSPFDFTSGAEQPVQEGSECIRLVQSLLNKVLSLNLPVDGVMNIQTRSAIRSFQSQKHSPADDAADSPTEGAPVEDAANEPNQSGDDTDQGQEEYDAFEFYDTEADYFELEEEVNSQSVDYAMWVQQSLNRILGLRRAVDVNIGAQTRSAIRSFQQKQNLTADGIVGSMTERALIRAGASSPPQSSGTSPAPTIPAGAPGIVTVRGIKVARQIAPQVEALLAAAAADGVKLSGGGFRTAEQQIKLRIAHCGGNTRYHIYEKPSRECTPPTATPGRSNHEKGLAIDFTYNGKIINSRSNPGFIWLAKNAKRFGLFNLPSEPWHWSVNGK